MRGAGPASDPPSSLMKLHAHRRGGERKRSLSWELPEVQYSVRGRAWLSWGLMAVEPLKGFSAGSISDQITLKNNNTLKFGG